MKIYIVAQSSDEYDDTLQLRDVLRTHSVLSPYHTLRGRSMAFKSLDDAQAYLNSFDGKPAYSDGSGNLKDDFSIFETEME